MTPQDSQNLADIRAYLAALYEQGRDNISAPSASPGANSDLKPVLNAILCKLEATEKTQESIRSTNVLIRIAIYIFIIGLILSIFLQVAL